MGELPNTERTRVEARLVGSYICWGRGRGQQGGGQGRFLCLKSLLFLEVHIHRLRAFVIP